MHKAEDLYIKADVGALFRNRPPKQSYFKVAGTDRQRKIETRHFTYFSCPIGHGICTNASFRNHIDKIKSHIPIFPFVFLHTTMIDFR
jgi:hypothetical protein